PSLLRTKMIGFKPLRPIVPTSLAVSWCDPSPVKSTVRRDRSASAIPSVAPVAHPIEPQRGWLCTSAPSGSDFSGAIDWTARRNYLALFSQVCDIESSRLWRFDRYRLTHIRRWMERRERGTHSM